MTEEEEQAALSINPSFSTSYKERKSALVRDVERQKRDKMRKRSISTGAISKDALYVTSTSVLFAASSFIQGDRASQARFFDRPNVGGWQLSCGLFDSRSGQLESVSGVGKKRCESTRSSMVIIIMLEV